VEIDLTRIFVKVVQNGSFSRAADLLKCPKSTVSKAVSRLEAKSGTKLLLRTTRSLTLTAAGRAYYETCLGPIQVIEDAQKSLHGQDSLLSGLVRMTAPEDLGATVLTPVMADLTLRHPALKFELHFTDEVVDLVKDGFDLAVRLGRLNESSFKIKKAGEVYLVPVASPKYLRTRDKIREPRDLAGLDALTFSDQPYATHWTLKSGKATQKIPINTRVTSNQMTSLLRVALGGGGVAMVPHYICRGDIESGKLVRLLPDWSGPGIPASVISPLASSSSARLKITIDAVSAAVQAALDEGAPGGR